MMFRAAGLTVSASGRVAVLLIPVIALGLVAVAPPARADWSSAGVMSDARQWATATRLPDGRVLVAGGLDSTNPATPTATADIYDPVTGTWSPAASMGTARYAAAAVLLPNGRVLVAGGDQGSPAFNALASAEIYDPATDTWSAAASMSHARAWFTATVLGNGKVLVEGGAGNDFFGFPPQAELYDPTTDTWSSAGSMSTGRVGATATLLPDGRVLVAGGWILGQNFVIFASSEVYNPSTNAWSSAKSMATARFGHTATPLPGGDVLVAGGFTQFSGEGGTALASAEIYDPVSNSWTPAAPMSVARGNATADLSLDGRVLVVGGAASAPHEDRLPSAATTAGVESYDPASNTWSALLSLSQDRELATASVLGDGRVLVAGGGTGQGNGPGQTDLPLSGAELYRAPIVGWARADAMATGRFLFTATRLADGRVLVAGGITLTEGGAASAELYDPDINSWSRAGPMNVGRFGHAAVRLKDGRVLVVGGFSDPGGTQASAEIYNPSTDHWSLAAPMATARDEPTATLLKSGDVLVTGGEDDQGNDLQSAELYDPTTGTWSSAGMMSFPRFRDTATLLKDGWVLVAGGKNGIFALTSADLYDPSTNSWSAAASMGDARLNHTATLLSSGKVLVVGGTRSAIIDTPLTSAELFDPVADTWSDAGHTATARELASAALLPTGDVLLAGGLQFSSSLGYQSTELYDPTTNAWYSTFALHSGRYYGLAVPLADGRVLITGGATLDSLPTTAELYPAPVPVGVFDGLYQPTALTLSRQGMGVRWTDDQGKHTVTDALDLGAIDMTPAPLFDSGLLKTKQSFSFTFFAAGSYKYHSTANEPGPMIGTVKVPVAASLTRDGTGRFLIRWSSSDLPGFVYDVQYRFKPAGGSFGPWTAWTPPGGGADWGIPDSLFTPSGTGTYQFRADLKNATTGNVSGFSPAATILLTKALLRRLLTGSASPKTGH